MRLKLRTASMYAQFQPLKNNQFLRGNTGLTAKS